MLKGNQVQICGNTHQVTVNTMLEVMEDAAALKAMARLPVPTGAGVVPSWKEVI